MPTIPREIYCNFLTESYDVSGTSYTLADLFSNAYPPNLPLAVDANGLLGAETDNTGDTAGQAPYSTHSGPYSLAVGALYQTGLLCILSFLPATIYFGTGFRIPYQNYDWNTNVTGATVRYLSEDEVGGPAAVLGDDQNDNGPFPPPHTITLAATDTSGITQVAFILDPNAGMMALSVNGSAVTTATFQDNAISHLDYIDQFFEQVGSGDSGGWIQYIAYYAATIEQAPQLPLWSIVGDTPPDAIVFTDLTGVSSFAAPGYTNNVRMTRSYTDGF